MINSTKNTNVEAVVTPAAAILAAPLSTCGSVMSTFLSPIVVPHEELTTYRPSGSSGTAVRRKKVPSAAARVVPSRVAPSLTVTV